MPWVRTIPREEAGPALAEVFAQLGVAAGRMFTPFEPITANPGAMKAIVALDRAIRFADSDLSRREREMIATYVSALNDCTF